MPTIDGLDPGLQGLLTTLFVLAVAAFSAWSHVFGRKAGKPPDRVKEFSATTQLADMGPVKELVENVGLLVHQESATKMMLERCAVAIEALALAYQGQIEAQATQEEVEKRAQELFERRLAAERPKPRRRPTARKKPAAPAS